MNTIHKPAALAAALLSLAVSSAFASAVSPNWAQLEREDVEDVALKPVTVKTADAAPSSKARPEAAPAPAPAPAGSANPLARGGSPVTAAANPAARGSTPNVGGTAPAGVPGLGAAASAAVGNGLPAAGSGSSERTLNSPWGSLVYTGPLPKFPNPAPCTMGNDAFSPMAPKCPPGYTPGEHELQCKGYASIVKLGDSIVCASNSIGLSQLQGGGLSAKERSDAEAYLMARGLPSSAAAYAANAMNSQNLQAFTCYPYKFVHSTPMSEFKEIEWNLILYGYVYSQLTAAKTDAQPPAFCDRRF